MDIHNLRKLLKTKSIYDIALRVTFYARVSSEKDEQLNSLDNQISYYKNLIQRNSCWSYVDGYIDEGISGISTKKRESFHNMIRDAEEGLFDLIITKEITRFARNTLDSISFTRDLLGYGVGVFFQNDNINTLDEDSELRLTIMSGIAQDELRKLSSRIKFGHQEAIKKNVVFGNSRIFGYTKNNKKLVIDEKEAEMVKDLFTLYATNEYSMKQIEGLFWEKGYRNLNGNKISHSTMSNMISNPKYKGYYVGNKVKVVDMFTKKQKFLPPEEWVMFKDETGEIVPAIVDEELWEKANNILKSRSMDVKQRQNRCNHANLLTGKLFCTHCGLPYYRKDSKDRTGEKNSQWVCSGKLKNGTDSCPSFAIYESEIKPILYDVFKETSGSIEALVEKCMERYQSLQENKNLSGTIKKLSNKIETINKKKDKLLEYNVNGRISDDDFLKMNKSCSDEISKIETEISEFKKQMNSKEELKEHIKEIRKTLEEAEREVSSGIINKNFIDNYIDKIYVTPQDGLLQLKIKIFTGEMAERYFTNLKIRTGHMVKKMIKEYESSLK